MKSIALWPLGLALFACMSTGRPIPRASPEEAAKVEFPRFDLPPEGLLRIQGNMAAAIQLAMDDFLPSGAPRASSKWTAPCLQLRESYDVRAAYGPESVVLVQFNVNPAACATNEQVVDVTTYAIDVRTMRVLSFERRTKPNKSSARHAKNSLASKSSADLTESTPASGSRSLDTPPAPYASSAR